MKEKPTVYYTNNGAAYIKISELVQTKIFKIRLQEMLDLIEFEKQHGKN